MANIPKKITERVRAIIIDQGKILLINRIKGNNSYWVIPGGAVESGESHEQAVKRECLEELGVKIEAQKLFLQRLGDKPEIEGQQEFFYLCNIIDGQIGTGQGPEFQVGTQYKGEYKIKWVDLKDLPEINLKPEEVKNKIIQQAILDKINHSIVGEVDIQNVVAVLKSGFLSKPDGGPKVIEFQKLMAELHSKKYAFAVNSGTSALHCAVVALELQKDDEIIVPALANIADCSVVLQENGNPVFVDIGPEDFNMDPAKIEEKINPRTKAIIAVHMYGQPAKIKEIRKIADKHRLVLIEDCAQAAGAKYENEYVGSFGDLSCFSLYQTKHIICGEGGVVMTSNGKYARIIASIANNGIMKHDLDAYDYDRIGFNYQLTDIQAALAIGQLKNLDKNNEKRRLNAEIFRNLLRDTDIQFQHTNSTTKHSYFYLTALLPKHLSNQRDKFLELVKSFGAPIKKLYPLTLTEVVLLRSKVKQDCPIAQDITKRMFNVYVNHGLNREDIKFMAKAVKKAYEVTKANRHHR